MPKPRGQRKWLLDASPGDRTTDVAALALRQRFAAVRYYLPLASDKWRKDVEYVHQLRVATRRAAAATGLFDEFLPRKHAKWMNRWLKKLRRAAGEARDLDVLGERLRTMNLEQVNQSLLPEIQLRRSEAQRPIVELRDHLTEKDRFRRHATKLQLRVRPQRNADGVRIDPPLREWACETLRSIVAEFIGATPADCTDLKSLHRFRIHGKRVRYAMELLAAAFPSDFRKALYPIIVRLQEKLGEINDHATAQVRFQQWSESARDDAGEVWRTLEAEEQAALNRTLQAFTSWWTNERQQDLRARFDKLLGVGGRQLAG